MIPIHTELLSVLKRLPLHTDGLVFHGSRGGRLNPHVVRWALIRNVLEPLAPRSPTAERVIGFVHGRVHRFRHDLRSQCADRGVPQRVRMTWLSHSDSRMAEHYHQLHNDEGQLHTGRLGPATEKTPGSKSQDIF